MSEEQEKLELSPEEAVALHMGIKIMMGTIMKSNKFLLTLTHLDEEQIKEITELLDIYSSLYDQYLEGDAKDQVIAALTKGEVNGKH